MDGNGLSAFGFEYVNKQLYLINRHWDWGDVCALVHNLFSFHNAVVTGKSRKIKEGTRNDYVMYHGADVDYIFGVYYEDNRI